MAEFVKIKDLKADDSQADWMNEVIGFLKNYDIDAVFNSLDNGDGTRVEIDGDRIFANFQKYDSKDASNPVFEVHEKYIDVQYVHSGCESILVTDDTNATTVQEYDGDADCQLYTAPEYSSLLMKSGDVALLYPAELHAPCLTYKQTQPIEKVVVKVRVE